MGKTPKPLTIVALPPCCDWPELAELEAKGHKIRRVAGDVGDYGSLWVDADIILGSNCWRMTEQHRKYLVLAIKEARMLKYPPDKRMDTKTRNEVGLEDLA